MPLKGEYAPGTLDWARQQADLPVIVLTTVDDYQARTDRVIPLFVVEPVDG